MMAIVVQPMKRLRVLDRFELESGPVVLEWPTEITQEEATDLEEWIGLILSKWKRAALSKGTPNA